MAHVPNKFTRLVTSGFSRSSSYFKVLRAVRSNGDPGLINHEARSDACPRTISKVWSLGRIRSAEEMLGDGGGVSSSENWKLGKAKLCNRIRARCISVKFRCLRIQTRWSWTVMILTLCSWSKNAENWRKSLKLSSIKRIFVKLGNLSNGRVEATRLGSTIEIRFNVNDLTEGKVTRSNKGWIDQSVQLKQKSRTYMMRWGFCSTVSRKELVALMNLAQVGWLKVTEWKIRACAIGSQNWQTRAQVFKEAKSPWSHR